MRCLSSLFLSCFGVLALGVAAQAQSQRPYYERNRDDYFGDRYPQQRGYGYGNQQFVIDRVMSDLNRAAARARMDGHESHHFDEVARNLQEFQARWARGKFDTGKLDKAIHNLEHLSEADRVRGRDRGMLAQDLADLRQFRASRGYRQYPDYYPGRP